MAGGTVNLNSMIETLNSVANDYEASIDELISAASDSGSIDMSATVVQTTNVSLSQSILEMVQGASKQVTDQIKKQGSNVSR
jgi:Ni,Fe-hydrogenase maturation factor